MKGSLIFVFVLSLLLNNLNLYSQQGQWTWMRGDSICDAPGHYGIMGVADPANNPPARSDAACWTDLNGNFWLFGGPHLTDLWFYNVQSNQWTWVNGSNTLNSPVKIYGTLGIPSQLNTPGRRQACQAWVDLAGDLWLFGGSDNIYIKNDLWKYHIPTNEWTWMKGDSSGGGPGNYGIMGVANALNNPPPRMLSEESGWTDNNGNLWLFGGYPGNGGFSDIWRYNIITNQWTWMQGPNTLNQTTYHGTMYISSSLNTPGARGGFNSWKDSDGNFWIFGGALYQDYNDLWRFDIQTLEWTWVGGPNIPDQPGICNGICQSSVNNLPSGRYANIAWKGNCDLFYFYGGYFGLINPSSGNGPMNDLWCFDSFTHSWTFVKGSLVLDDPGHHGIMTIPGPANFPRALNESCHWTDLAGNFWLFGGTHNLVIYDCPINELWRYTPDSLCPINLPLAVISISNDTNICAGDSIGLRASGGSQYLWIPTINISNPHVSNPIVFPDTTTTYTVSISNGSCHKSLSVTIQVNTGSSLTLLSHDTIICEGDSILLHACGGLTYHWEPNQFLNNTNIPNPKAFPDSSMTFLLTVSDTCHSRDFTVYVEVIPNSSKKIITNDTALCKGQSLVVMTSGGNQYAWSNAQNTPAIFVSPEEPTNYSVTITDNYGCQSHDSVLVNVFDLPDIQITPSDTMICAGSTVLLTACGALTYQWSPPQGLSSTVANPVTASPLQSTIYSVTGTDQNLCQNTRQVGIYVTGIPVSYLPAMAYFCDRTKLILDPGFDPDWIYTWNDGTMGNLCTVKAPGTYWVAILNPACSFAITDTVEVLPCIDLWVSNAFSPDGNGDNDIFLAYASAPLKSFQMLIYNRWGELIFESGEITMGWDGSFKNEKCPVDIYVWVINYETVNPYKSLQRRGIVTLIN